MARLEKLAPGLRIIHLPLRLARKTVRRYLVEGKIRAASERPIRKPKKGQHHSDERWFDRIRAAGVRQTRKRDLHLEHPEIRTQQRRAKRARQGVQALAAATEARPLPEPLDDEQLYEDEEWTKAQTC
ncbi:hypothetical protein LTR85_008792 [Meristemomyces frigidus]|nr:hypothetical protein LTR85_008792 [Meristemomyces frigidus]